MAWTWLTKFFGSNAGEAVKKSLHGVGDLAKDIKTIVTGKVDPETLITLEEKFAKLDSMIAEHQSTVVSSEAQGNWLQRSWRPITMLTFLVLVIFNQFGLLIIPLAEDIWDLFKVGLGGYIGGRSLEKVVATIKK